MSLTSADYLAFRYPSPVPNCTCGICTRLGATPEDLHRCDNIPSVFQQYRLVKHEPDLTAYPYAATQSTDQKSMSKLVKVDKPMNDEEFQSLEASQPQTALWLHQGPNQIWAKSCLRIVKKLRNQKLAMAFNTPVDYTTLGLLDYPNIIKHPMDFGTIERKLCSDPLEYEHPEQFVNDVRMIFRNCLTYNGLEHAVTQCAKQLSAQFEQALSQL